jgi:ribosome-associated protein
LRSSTLARKIARLTLTKKSDDVIIMDLRTLTPMADFFVICSADSDVQMKAIAEGVEEGLEKLGAFPWHKESGSANWILLDYVDVILHVFHKNIRSFYSLERLWGDAKFMYVSEDGKLATRRPSRASRSARKKIPARKTAS